jgi:serine/threonine protein kinase
VKYQLCIKHNQLNIDNYNRLIMCKGEKKCRAWISLDSIGINFQGCLRDSELLNTIIVSCNQSLVNQTIYINKPFEKLYSVKNVAHGSFGFIDTGIYEKDNKKIDVFIKRPISSGKSLLYEACIQKLVRENLTNIGFPTGAPEVLCIFKLKDNSICFAMEQILGSLTLDKFLESIDTSKISNVIIDCLLQLSAMIWYLESTLGINHRDLKPSNFLIRKHEPKILVLQIENEILEIESKYSLTFIDFGFSCLGSTETLVSDISLSTVYSKDDPCPKEGRDMYLFLAFLYIDFYSKLPSKLLILFESWLHIPGSKIINFMKKDKTLSREWIYYITGNENIKNFNCSPCRIVKDLQGFI